MMLPELLFLLMPAAQDVVVQTAAGARKLSSYSFASNVPLRPGAYRAELDGAKLELNVSEIAGRPGALLVSRSFYRPGQTLLRKSYIHVQRDASGNWEARGGLKLRLPQDLKLGLVVQETSSGVDAIPSTAWIQYLPK